MVEVESSIPEIQNAARLGRDDRLTFSCDPALECFGQCCRDISIALTPYDVLRMKTATREDSSQFLERHTSVATSTETGVPVVFLKMEGEQKKCSLLGEKGCGIYANRPWACRMYPLGMAEPADPNQTGRRFYFVVKEELCKGHGKGRECSVGQFLDSQAVEPYELMQTSFRKLLALAAERKEPFTTEQAAMYYMALYDLDRFRRFVFETRFLEMFDVDESVVHEIRTSDEELLELAVKWLAFSLFQQRSMRLSKIAAQRQSSGVSAQGESGTRRS